MEIDHEIRKIGFEISQKRRGMSQKELAEKANITQQQISKIEAGMNCHLATLLKVCGALNLKIEIK
ncbi:MAG: helix-turn-helix transcriptional regulator [Candidatus Aminicenantes bacterium]|jgi:DNA-binding Xre family transcriptional regulator